jgi:hypothetical protein
MSQKNTQENMSDESPKTRHSVEQIDWKKVGRIHAPDAAVETVIGKEVNRLQKALDIKMTEQMEAIANKATEKKK